MTSLWNQKCLVSKCIKRWSRAVFPSFRQNNKLISLSHCKTVCCDWSNRMKVQSPNPLRRNSNIITLTYQNVIPSEWLIVRTLRYRLHERYSDKRVTQTNCDWVLSAKAQQKQTSSSACRSCASELILSEKQKHNRTGAVVGYVHCQLKLINSLQLDTEL